MPGYSGKAKPYPNNIKDIIKMQGYRIKDVAESLNIPRATLTDYIVGNRPAPRAYLTRLAEFIGCTIEDFRYFRSAEQLPGQETPEIYVAAPITQSLVPISAESPLVTQEQPYVFSSLKSIITSNSLLARVMMLIYHNSQPMPDVDNLQNMVDLEIRRYKQMKAHDEPVALSRRDALIMIASFPLSLLLKRPQEITLTSLTEEFLASCTASITACWHLLQSKQLAVVGEALSSYMPSLEELAQQASKYQNVAASLATQGYRIIGMLALHRNDFSERNHAFQRAVYYAEIANNPRLLVAALISLAYHDNSTEEAARIYLKALSYLHYISPLQRSRLYVELAVVSAQQKQEQEALRYIGLAQDIYPEHPEYDPSFLYADFSVSFLHMEKGRTYLALAEHEVSHNYAKQAEKTFAQFEQGQPVPETPERIRLEIINYRAKTAVMLHNVDDVCHYLEQGIRGAKMLGSEKRRQEALTVHKAAREQWPHEQKVWELVDLFL